MILSLVSGQVIVIVRCLLNAKRIADLAGS
jgi:hypothetical protein